MNRNASDLSGLLRTIVEAKRVEVAGLRRDAGGLRRRAESRVPGPGFEGALRAGGGVGVIAEVKRRSPSAGDMGTAAEAAAVAQEYERAGATAVSVLTDGEFFGGSLSDLESAAEKVSIPLLRKDFTIDALQVYEARAAGASAVLLIVRILDDAQLRDFAALARELELAALTEVHNESEVERALSADSRIVGVNNRDLATFTTDLGVTERLVRYLPPDILAVGESGVRETADVQRLAAAGVDAVLVGEVLMRSPDAGELIAGFAAVPRQVR